MSLDDLNSEELTSKFSDLFEFNGMIGQGAFGVVVAAIDKETNQECAVKVIPKQRISSKNYNLFKKEAQILSSLNHPNIVRFKDIKETDKRLFLVMELVHDGHLKNLIEERAKSGIGFTELEASTIMKQIFNAVSYMHKVGVIHRDLKPENILIENRNDLSTIKIADFGLSAQYGQENGRSYSQQCGTMIYMAPELAFQKIYSKPVDIWSCGIILYILCSKGKHPLYKNTDNLSTFLEKLKNPKWNFHNNFPKLAKNLFEKLMNQEPYARYTAEDACNHPWLTGKINDDIPLTANEIWHYFDLEQNFSKILKSLMFLNYLKKCHMKILAEESQKELASNIEEGPNNDQKENNIKGEYANDNILLEKKYMENIFHLYVNDEHRTKLSVIPQQIKTHSMPTPNEQEILPLEDEKKIYTINYSYASDYKIEKAKAALAPIVTKGATTGKKKRCSNSFLPDANTVNILGEYFALTSNQDSPTHKKSFQSKPDNETRITECREKAAAYNFDSLLDKRLLSLSNNGKGSAGKPPKAKQSVKSILLDKPNKQQLLPKLAHHGQSVSNEYKMIPALNPNIFSTLIQREGIKSSSHSRKSATVKVNSVERLYKPQILDENILSPYYESRMESKTHRLDITPNISKEKEKYGYSGYTQSALQKIKQRLESQKRGSIMMTTINGNSNCRTSLGPV